MTEIDMILALLKEVDSELTYNRDFARHEERAEAIARRDGKNTWESYKYMPKEFDREPRKSVILDDLKMVRRLCLKIYKKVEASPCGY